MGGGARLGLLVGQRGSGRNAYSPVEVPAMTSTLSGENEREATGPESCTWQVSFMFASKVVTVPSPPPTTRPSGQQSSERMPRRQAGTTVLSWRLAGLAGLAVGGLVSHSGGDGAEGVKRWFPSGVILVFPCPTYRFTFTSAKSPLVVAQ